MPTKKFDPWIEVRLGALPEDTEFMYKGARYKVMQRSRWHRINATTGSVYVSRTDQVTTTYKRKRWTLLARTAILQSDVFYKTV